ncbi:MAG: PhzF family phenazine biosynthesis protein [Candidatus Wallbacteria bacterium]|nr:PhzF family phenazine biosynthesis protein [Candidatus Wallbacteria bacterium]
MQIPLWQVDAFTGVAFRGNPAAVCLLEKPLVPAVMQSIAAEMNLSETAFLVPLDTADCAQARTFALRWFTPTVEVPLCGHATLASSAVLFGETGSVHREIEFQTASGKLCSRKTEHGLEIDLPGCPSHSIPCPESVLGPLGIADVEEARLANDGRKLLLRLPPKTDLRAIAPDFSALLVAVPPGVRGVVVTQKSAPPYDFISRYFAPWAGVPEDPVTGAAHCALGPYWGEVLQKNQLAAHQASARGGDLMLRLSGDRVLLSGKAVVVFEGKLRL